jgi:phage baseplate assembly protein W
MTNVEEIRNANWQLSTAGFGEISEGTADINQCLAIILATRKGSDCFRPTFGSDIFEHVDKPLTLAGPKMVSAIYDSIATWEQRVKVQAVTYEFQKQDEGDANAPVCGLKFKISWKAATGADNGEIEILYNKVVGEPTFIIRVLADENGVAISTEEGVLIQI